MNPNPSTAGHLKTTETPSTVSIPTVHGCQISRCFETDARSHRVSKKDARSDYILKKDAKSHALKSCAAAVRFQERSCVVLPYLYPNVLGCEDRVHTVVPKSK